MPRPNKKQHDYDSPERGTVEMTPEQIATAEHERRDLLTRLGASVPQGPASPVQLVEEPSAPEPAPVPTGPSSLEISDLIQRENQAHHEALERAEREFKARLNELLKQRQEAEAAEARAVDTGVQARLKEATTAALASVAAEAPTDRELAGERDRAQLRTDVDAATKGAKQALREIEQLMNAHSTEISRLSGITEPQWRRGLPGQGQDAARAFHLARSIPVQIEDLRSFVALVRKQADDNVRELERAVESAPVPFGARNTAAYFNWAPWHAGALRDLKRVDSGTVAFVQSKVRTLLGAVTAINELRERYRGRPEAGAPFVTESPSKVIENIKKASAYDASMPPHADIDYSPFGGR